MAWGMNIASIYSIGYTRRFLHCAVRMVISVGFVGRNFLQRSPIVGKARDDKHLIRVEIKEASWLFSLCSINNARHLMAKTGYNPITAGAFLKNSQCCTGHSRRPVNS